MHFFTVKQKQVQREAKSVYLSILDWLMLVLTAPSSFPFQHGTD
jgi:hypothetical protein